LPQTPNSIGFLPLGGHHDDGNETGLGVVDEHARRLVAVDAGHHDVHENKVGLHGLRLTHPFLAVLGGGGFETVLLEGLLHNEDFSG
jgi:hypothetical protein